jgi:tetratricopeptide (TPR) repeat protein
MVHGLLTTLGMIHLDLGCRLARAVLAHPDAQGEDLARGRAMYTAGWMDFFAGRYECARSHVEAGVRISRACNDRQGLAEGMYRLGHVCAALGRTTEAREHFEEELEIARELGNPMLAGEAHGGLSEMYWHMGSFELAQHHGRESFAAGSQEPDFLATGNLNLARNAIMLREQAASIRHIRAALAALSPSTMAQRQQALVVCGAAALLRGEATRALRYLGAAAAHRERTGWRNPGGDALFEERSVRAAREAAGQAADEAYDEGLRMDDVAALEDVRTWVQSLPPAAPVLEESGRVVSVIATSRVS